MNTTAATDRVDEIQRYLNGVSAALSDLPDDVRQELLDDLSHHLAEIAAEDPASLESRLGSPRGYAAELRTAVGVDVSARQRRTRQLDDMVARVRPYAKAVDVKVGQFIGYERLVDFLVLLRPAWWVIRGYAVALVVITVLTDNSGVLPDSNGVGVFGWLFALLLIGASIRLGRRPLHLPLRARQAWIAASALIVVAILYGVATIDDVAWRYPSFDSGQVSYDDRSEVYTYDEDGRPTTGVHVYNRDGSPVPVGAPLGCGPTSPPWQERRGCPPTADPSAALSPEPSADPSLTPEASPQRSADPTPVPSPSLTAGPSPSG